MYAAAVKHLDIGRIIRERARDKPDRATLRADLDEYLRRYAGKGPHRTQEEIEDLVSSVMDEREDDHAAPG
jgi:hypothetical protein